MRRRVNFSNRSRSIPANVELSVSVVAGLPAPGRRASGDQLCLKTLSRPRLKAPSRNLALAYVFFTSQNKTDLALKSATQALELDPNNILAYIYLRTIFTR